MHGPYDDPELFPELNDEKARTARIERKRLLKILGDEEEKVRLFEKYLGKKEN